MNIETIEVNWGINVEPIIKINHGNVTDRWFMIKDSEGNIRRFRLSIHGINGILESQLVSFNGKPVCPQCGRVLDEEDIMVYKKG